MQYKIYIDFCRQEDMHHMLIDACMMFECEHKQNLSQDICTGFNVNMNMSIIWLVLCILDPLRAFTCNKSIRHTRSKATYSYLENKQNIYLLHACNLDGTQI